MACLINTGYNNGCRDNLGGVQVVYIRSYTASTTYTYDSTGQITGGTNTNSSFYTIQQRTEAAKFDAGVGAHSIENGTNYYTQSLDLVFLKYQASIRSLIYTLAQSEVDVLVLNQNGDYFVMGEQNGANLTASNSQIGKLFGDMNGASCTLTAKEPWPARQASAAYVATLTLV